MHIENFCQIRTRYLFMDLILHLINAFEYLIRKIYHESSES